MHTRTWDRYATAAVGRPAFVTEHRCWTERQLAAAEEIEAGLDQLDFVRLVFCDPHGLARSKTLSAQAFRAVLRHGMDFSPGPFIFDTGHAVAVDFLGDPQIGIAEIAGAGDFVVVPDPRTFQVLPGSTPRTAWVLGDEYLRDGRPHQLSSRQVLRRVVERYAAQRLEPVVGLEVEWYLTRRLPGPVGNEGNGFGSQGSAPDVVAMNAGYQFNLDAYYDTVASVTDPLALRLIDLGLPLRSMEHESGPGQVETTFEPLGALDAADAMLLSRTQIKRWCAERGYLASFMSLPGIAGFDASGWHLHQSVVESTTGRNVFAAENTGDDLSREGKAYVDGLLARARDLCLLSVPTVNGYRRLDPAFSLAPTRIGWAVEDRTAMIRVLGGGSGTHLENRVGEPSANPYLLIAAQLSAGLDGLLGEAGTAEPGGTLPASLAESLRAFRAATAPSALLGQPLAACLTRLKESEVARFEAWLETAQPSAGAVTDWEQREYFGVY